MSARTQPLLFESHCDLIKPEPTDPHVEPADKPRLRGQNAAILERLKCAPATNTHLAAISLKYTSRVSDLRAAGYDIQCQRTSGGINWYTLKE